MRKTHNIRSIICRILVIGAVSFLFLLSGPGIRGQTKPQWRFSVMASVGDSALSHFGGLEAVQQLVWEQFDTINSRFNAPGVFDGVFDFSVDSFHLFTGNPLIQISQPHPGFDYQIVYDCVEPALGNWIGPPDNGVLMVIPLEGWYIDIFGNRAAQILTHELGHARGAVDIYGLKVNASLNEISGTSYDPTPSIMNAYRDSVWDQHSINVINRRGDQVIEEGGFRLSSYFPSEMAIRLANVYGAPLDGATVKVYAHEWYDLALIPEPIAVGQTDDEGVFEFRSNPFTQAASPFPPETDWGIYNSALLISAEVYGGTRYFWLPFTAMQNRYFDTGTEPYVHDILISPCSGDCDENVPGYFVLYQNFPNPFNASTEICVDLESDAHTLVEIYNLIGRREAVLCDERREAGLQYFVWDAGRSASGIYFCRVTVAGHAASRKMLLLK